tara:strand:+ start:27705 stop:28403 length:699 start_codon:yes stop_codon:yes gene_type:complete
MIKTPLISAVILLLFCACGKDGDLWNEEEDVPGQALLVFPDNNEECTQGNTLSPTENEIVFMWEPSLATDSYELFLTNLFTSETQQFESEVPTLTATLLRGTPYSWYVVSRATDVEETAQSETWAFYNAGPGVEFFIPFPAEAVSPVNGRLLQRTTTVTLEWSAADLDGDITYYDIFFGESDPPILVESDHGGTTLENIPVVPGNTYYWKVVTKDQRNNSSTSETFTFTVDE